VSALLWQIFFGITSAKTNIIGAMIRVATSSGLAGEMFFDVILVNIAAAR
jgi:hypothetical protein